ncbi:hypothetical protein WR25_13195, partial [Diploscapter pachys]
SDSVNEREMDAEQREYRDKEESVFVKYCVGQDKIIVEMEDFNLFSYYLKEFYEYLAENEDANAPEEFENLEENDGNGMMQVEDVEMEEETDDYYLTPIPRALTAEENLLQSVIWMKNAETAKHCSLKEKDCRIQREEYLRNAAGKANWN